MVERRIGVAVLAAGSSRRFGDTDKLTADFRGKPLGEHVVSALPAERFSHKWVVSSSPEHPLAQSWEQSGFEVVYNNRASRGMGTSVGRAAYSAQWNRCDALLIALADMPLVPTAHFIALLDALTRDDDIIASSNSKALMPPAIFGKAHLERLSGAGGDEGARRWLRDGRAINCPHDWLTDIDTPEDLQKYGQA